MPRTPSLSLNDDSPIEMEGAVNRTSVLEKKKMASIKTTEDSQLSNEIKSSVFTTPFISLTGVIDWLYPLLLIATSASRSSTIPSFFYLFAFFIYVLYPPLYYTHVYIVANTVSTAPILPHQVHFYHLRRPYWYTLIVVSSVLLLSHPIYQMLLLIISRPSSSAESILALFGLSSLDTAHSFLILLGDLVLCISSITVFFVLKDNREKVGVLSAERQYAWNTLSFICLFLSATASVSVLTIPYFFSLLAFILYFTFPFTVQPYIAQYHSILITFYSIYIPIVVLLQWFYQISPSSIDSAASILQLYTFQLNLSPSISFVLNCLSTLAQIILFICIGERRERERGKSVLEERLGGRIKKSSRSSTSADKFDNRNEDNKSNDLSERLISSSDIDDASETEWETEDEESIKIITEPSNNLINQPLSPSLPPLPATVSISPPIATSTTDSPLSPTSIPASTPSFINFPSLNKAPRPSSRIRQFLLRIYRQYGRFLCTLSLFVTAFAFPSVITTLLLLLLLISLITPVSIFALLSPYYLCYLLISSILIYIFTIPSFLPSDSILDLIGLSKYEYSVLPLTSFLLSALLFSASILFDYLSLNTLNEESILIAVESNDISLIQDTVKSLNNMNSISSNDNSSSNNNTVLTPSIKNLFSIRDEQGRTLLHVAAAHGHTRLVSLLCRYIPVNSTDIHGNSALHLAYMNGHNNTVMILLLHPNINEYQTNHKNQTIYTIQLSFLIKLLVWIRYMWDALVHVVMTNADKITLVLLYIVATSNVDIIHLIFFLFFLLFFIFPKLARNFWYLLVIYSGFVLISLYTYSTAYKYTVPPLPSSIGLFPSSNYFIDFVLFYLIYLLVIIQWSVYTKSEENLQNKLKEEEEYKKKVKFKRAVSMLPVDNINNNNESNNYNNNLISQFVYLILALAALLIVALLPTLSLFKLGYLILFLLLLHSHIYLHNHPKLHILMWALASIYSFLLLALEYAYLCGVLHSYSSTYRSISNQLDVNITIFELGFVKTNGNYLLFVLLPFTVVFVACLIQVRVMVNTIRNTVETTSPKLNTKKSRRKRSSSFSFDTPHQTLLEESLSDSLLTHSSTPPTVPAASPGMVNLERPISLPVANPEISAKPNSGIIKKHVVFSDINRPVSAPNSTPHGHELALGIDDRKEDNLFIPKSGHASSATVSSPPSHSRALSLTSSPYHRRGWSLDYDLAVEKKISEETSKRWEFFNFLYDIVFYILSLHSHHILALYVIFYCTLIIPEVSLISAFYFLLLISFLPFQDSLNFYLPLTIVTPPLTVINYIYQWPPISSYVPINTKTDPELICSWIGLFKIRDQTIISIWSNMGGTLGIIILCCLVKAVHQEKVSKWKKYQDNMNDKLEFGDDSDGPSYSPDTRIRRLSGSNKSPLAPNMSDLDKMEINKNRNTLHTSIALPRIVSAPSKTDFSSVESKKEDSKVNSQTYGTVVEDMKNDTDNITDIESVEKSNSLSAGQDNLTSSQQTLLERAQTAPAATGELPPSSPRFRSLLHRYHIADVPLFIRLLFNNLYPHFISFISFFYYNYGLHVCLLFLLLTAFYRSNIYSLVYLSTLLLYIVFGAHIMTRLWFTIVILLFFSLIWQYFILVMIVPCPFYSWPTISGNYNRWLVIGGFSGTDILFDCLTYFFICMQAKYFRDIININENVWIIEDILEKKKKSEQEYLEEIENDNNMDNVDDSNIDSHPHKKIYHIQHIQELAGNIWPAFTFYLFLLADKFFFIFIFIVGSSRITLLNTPYLLFSLYFLFSTHLYSGDIKLFKRQWLYLHYYNFFVLSVFLLYQLPFIPTQLLPVPAPYGIEWENVIGLKKFIRYSDNAESNVDSFTVNALSISGALIPILIFFLIDFQLLILTSTLYTRILHYFDTQHNLSYLRTILSAQNYQNSEKHRILTLLSMRETIATSFTRIFFLAQQLNPRFFEDETVWSTKKPRGWDEAIGADVDTKKKESEVKYKGEDKESRSNENSGLALEEEIILNEDISTEDADSILNANDNNSTISTTADKDKTNESESKESAEEKKEKDEHKAKPGLEEVNKSIVDHPIERPSETIALHEKELSTNVTTLPMTTGTNPDIGNKRNKEVEKNDDHNPTNNDPNKTLHAEAHNFRWYFTHYYTAFRLYLISNIDHTLYTNYTLTANHVILPLKALHPDNLFTLNLIYRYIVTNSQYIVYSVIVLKLLIYPSFLSIILPLLIFMYALFEYPRVNRVFWVFSFWYECLYIILIFLFQLPLFCTTDTYTLAPCNVRDNNDNSLLLFRFDHLIGLYNINYNNNNNNIDNINTINTDNNFFVFVLLDIIILLLIIWHREILLARGIWERDEREILDSQVHKDIAVMMKEERRLFKSNQSYYRTSKTNDTNEKSDSLNKHKQSSTLNSPLRPPAPSTPDNDSVSKNNSKLSTPIPAPNLHQSERVHSSFHWLKQKIRWIFSYLPVEIQDYYHKLIPRKRLHGINIMRPGVDYYSYLFLFELLSAILILTNWNNLASTTLNNSTTASLASNLFAGEMVLTLFVQIACIVADRMIYIFRSVLGKILLQYITVMYWHILIFFVWPIQSETGFTNSKSLITFYIIKILYFYYSSLQIKYGFAPIESTGFQDLTKHPGIYRQWIFIIYRAIPFVFELRTILDWMCTVSALDLAETFKLEDIYAKLYLTQCDILLRKTHNRGDARGWLEKITSGVLLFAVLLLIIFGPLLLFSSANPVTSSNVVTAAEIHLSLLGNNGEYPLLAVSSVSNIQSVSSEVYNNLRDNRLLDTNDQIDDVQLITMTVYSDDIWTISPPALSALINTLNTSSVPVRAHFTYAFTRNGPATFKVITGEVVTDPLSATIQQQLAVLISDNIPSAGSANNSNKTENVLGVTIPSVIPYILRLPSQATNPTEPVPEQRGDIYIDLIATTISNAKDGNNNNDLTTSFYWNITTPSNNNTLPLQFITISNRIFSGPLSSFNLSIVTVYFTVIFTIGQFVRLAFQGSSIRIPYEDIQNAEKLIALCEAVFVARQKRQLRMEESMYRRLIKIYRTPVLLIELTRREDSADEVEERREEEKEIERERRELKIEEENKYKEQEDDEERRLKEEERKYDQEEEENKFNGSNEIRQRGVGNSDVQ